MSSDARRAAALARGLAVLFGVAAAGLGMAALRHMMLTPDAAMICGAAPAAHCWACPAAFATFLAALAAALAAAGLESPARRLAPLQSSPASKGRMGSPPSRSRDVDIVRARRP